MEKQLQNIDAFRIILKQQDVQMEYDLLPDGTPFYHLNQKTETGCPCRLVVAFNKDNESVDVHCFILAPVEPEADHKGLSTLLNHLNENYRFVKFMVNKENIICISSSLDFEDNFNPEIVARHLVMVFTIANNEFKNFAQVCAPSAKQQEEA